MKVLVSGAAGFIGSHAVQLLEARQNKVIALDNFSTGRTENLKGFKGPIEICDVRDYDLLKGVFDRHWPEAVVHLAAQSAISTAWNSPGVDLDINARGTMNLLELSTRFGVERFIFASTAAVYGKSGFFSSKETDVFTPDTPYGISKMIAEHYIRLLHKNHVILRFANIYGPRQEPIGENQVVARALDHFLHGADFEVHGDGNQKRDFVYVDDVVHAIWLSLTSPTGTYNVASGKSRSVNDVLHEIEKLFEVEGYKWTHRKEPDQRGSVYMSGGKIRRELGWYPSVTLEEGIALTCDWWRENK